MFFTCFPPSSELWHGVLKTIETTKAYGASVLKDFVFINFHGSF